MRKHNENEQKNTTVGNSEAFQAGIMALIHSFACNVIDDEIEQLKKQAEIYRWGSQSGYFHAMGQRMSIDRPRARYKDSKQEVRLASYEQLQGKDQWTQQMCDMVLGGLATRQFDKLGKVVGSAYGMSKSQISRHVVHGLQRDFEALMETDCSDVVALLIDAKGFGKKPNEVCLIAALGITDKGEKKLIGLWTGGSENSAVARQLLTDLVRRGLKEPKLSVIDGSKALHKAIKDMWPDAVIGRCQLHKQRNLVSHVTQSQRDWVEREYRAIVSAPSYEEGMDRACALHKQLAKVNVTAANSLAEGLFELLVANLIKDKNLRAFFSTTNAIESMFSVLEVKTGRVRRWRSANSVMFWCATAYRQQKKNFHAIRGYKAIAELDQLKTRLAQAKEKLSPAARLVLNIQNDERRLKVG
jgi:transposase-like protein